MPPFISTISRFCPIGFAQKLTDTSGFASAVYVSTNRAYYFPLILPVDIVVKRFWWANGTVASTNKIQIGLYREDFTASKLGNQVTAAGASALQFDDIADTVIPAGRYYLAIWCNGTTATIVRKVPGVAGLGFFQENALTTGLTDPANPIAAANQYVPIFGLDLRGTP